MGEQTQTPATERTVKDSGEGWWSSSLRLDELGSELSSPTLFSFSDKRLSTQMPMLSFPRVRHSSSVFLQRRRCATMSPYALLPVMPSPHSSSAAGLKMPGSYQRYEHTSDILV